MGISLSGPMCSSYMQGENSDLQRSSGYRHLDSTNGVFVRFLVIREDSVRKDCGCGSYLQTLMFAMFGVGVGGTPGGDACTLRGGPGAWNRPRPAVSPFPG